MDETDKGEREKLLQTIKEVNVTDRKWLFKTYKRCFIGSEMVDLLVKRGIVESRAEAVVCGNILLKEGVFHHVTKDHTFKDEKLFYRFQDDELALRGIAEEQKSWEDVLPVKGSLEMLLPDVKGLDADMMSDLQNLQVSPLDVHNKKLLDNVHPASFTNPMPADHYNIVVIGAGAAGLVTAAGSAGVGAKVALIEEHMMGGDCLNIGCVPSKALLKSAHLAQEIRRAPALGVEVSAVTVDFGKVMERMRRLRAEISENDSIHRFQRTLGIDTFIGRGKFIGKDAVQVGDNVLRFSKCCIATGGSAAIPPIPGLKDVPFLTNASIFNLTELPPRFGVIGAGAIGCELAQAFRAFGSEVWLFFRSAHILDKEEVEAAEIVESQFLQEGINVYSNTKYEKIEQKGNEIHVHLTRNGKQEVIVVDKLLVATGRKPNVTDMGLEVAEVEYDGKKGIRVNKYLQTSNPNVYAAGDCCMAYKFTHAADFSARIVIRNALFWGKAKVTSLVIPWATYTYPEVAHVGLYPRDMEASGRKFTTFTKYFREVDRAIVDGEDKGFVRIHCAEGTDRILGATVVGSHAGDMIGELTLAVTNKVGLGAIAAVIHPYPTHADAIRLCGDLYSRTRLTPTVKVLFRKLLEAQR